jgi:hypothetical protein
MLHFAFLRYAAFVAVVLSLAIVDPRRLRSRRRSTSPTVHLRTGPPRLPKAPASEADERHPRGLGEESRSGRQSGAGFRPVRHPRRRHSR